MTDPDEAPSAKLPAQRRPSKPVKIPDEDRQRVIERLQSAAGEGYLTLDEFAERAGMVWAAATSMELDTIVSDLPAPAPAPAAVPAQPMVGETRRRKVRRWLVAIMSGSANKGRWRVGESVNALAIMGGVEIDLREAEFDAPELTIRAIAIMGGIDITVPEGIEVDMDAFAFMGGKDMKLASVPILPGAPRVRVTGFALMGGIGVKSRKHPQEIAAAREAKRLADRERRELRRAERSDRERGRGRDRNARGLPPLPPRPSLDAGRQLRREIRRTLHEQILESVEDGLASARGTTRDRDTRPPLSDRWATSDDDAAAVRRRLQRNGRPEGTVTIMFTDIEDSTQWTARLGDSDASLLVKEHNELVRAQVAAHGGYEVKFRGDGFMLVFTSASKGVRCAIALQQEMKVFAANHPEAPLRIRIGINSGEAVSDGNDFLGTAVNIAARLTDAAMGGEVIVSSVVRDLVSSTGEFSFEPEQHVALKGIDAPQRACLVAW